MSLRLSDDFDLGWFIGFVEAEGSFTSNKGRPFFSVAQKDRSPLDMIKTSISHGHISSTRNKLYPTESWRYCIYSLEELRGIVRIFNGNLKTEPKRAQFKFWINLHEKINCAFLPGKKEIQQTPFDEGWLVGFVEGDGSFTYKKSEGWPVFIVTQNDREILEKIRDYFSFGNVYKHSSSEECKAWRYVSGHNLDGLKPIRDFFKGKLKTKEKKAQFKFWSELFDPNHPWRVKGRENSRLRSKEQRRKNPDKHREAVKRWKRRNRDKVNEYKRKSYHRRKALEKTQSY